MAKWIWYNGDFESYHNLQLHTRREQYGMAKPPFWDIPLPYAIVEFYKVFISRKEEEVICFCKGEGVIWLDEECFSVDKPLKIKKGKHYIKICLFNKGGLPCIFINGEELYTDETWEATHGGAEKGLVGCIPAYTKENDNPQIFPFSYKKVDYIDKEEVEGGILFDFGKELFAKIVLNNLQNSDIYVYYGESKEEALSSADYGQCVIWEHLEDKEDVLLKARAFRYIRVVGKKARFIKIHALYEYLPLEIKGSFSCNEDSVKKIWNTCAYTFHLCAREFFLDGIKRDRWVWGGDARQSFMINDYVFADEEICKRTILALLPKDRVYQHVNTINDYSALLIISIWEYYQSFANKEFIKFVWPRIKMLFDYIVARLDENGFVVQRDGDWIFVDWAGFDKDGPLCAEQILFWRACIAMASLASVVGVDFKGYKNRADNLKSLIIEKYWREDKGAFIDGFVSGKNNVTRHANIFAILFDFVDNTRKEQIYKQVLNNENIEPINTPYFKLYEISAICSLGYIEEAQKLLGSYWGGMLQKGATTMWEEYKPEQSIPACYEMYGSAFEKSLCHAWSSGPIYFLGKYCLGVTATEPGYTKYKVQPNPGRYTSFFGVVPTQKGIIRVEYANGKLSVYSELDGGTLVWKHKSYPIVKNKILTV